MGAEKEVINTLRTILSLPDLPAESRRGAIAKLSENLVMAPSSSHSQKFISCNSLEDIQLIYDVLSSLKETGSRSLCSHDGLALIQRAYLHIIHACIANPTNVVSPTPAHPQTECPTFLHSFDVLLSNTPAAFVLAECQLAVAHTDRFFLPLLQREALADAYAAQGEEHKSAPYIQLYSRRCAKSVAAKKGIVRAEAGGDAKSVVELYQGLVLSKSCEQSAVYQELCWAARAA